MKRFLFQQQRLLNLKLQQQKQAETAVGLSRQAVVICEQKIAAPSDQLKQLSTQLEQNTDPSLTVRTLSQISGYQLQLAQMQTELKRLESEHQVNCDALRKITIEVETYQSLKDQRLREHKKRVDAKQQQIADELALNRTTRKMRQADGNKNHD